MNKLRISMVLIVFILALLPSSVHAKNNQRSRTNSHSWNAQSNYGQQNNNRNSYRGYNPRSRNNQYRNNRRRSTHHAYPYPNRYSNNRNYYNNYYAPYPHYYYNGYYDPILIGIGAGLMIMGLPY